ncbi:MAG: cupin domain-containing protein [Lachnospiraceae bacterium]|nr:cupin domain-containing protein [Lachnospiraceae bacterium]
MKQIYYDLSEAPIHSDQDRTDSTKRPAIVRPSCFNGSFSAIMVDYPEGFTWKEHHHAPEQITICFKGRMQYTVDGETHILEPGDTIYVPAWAMHTGIALEDCQAMDVFTPGRKDHEAWFDDSIEYKCEFTEDK